ncbi:transcription repressor OFP1-like [Phragmites australis]|uniref:transcription repressor OFP1-like n=1 Tax=Phragmites australis TaxID=29695 RepID=UPI002D792860|nr:transcription repressor OFP1-like [Phragmites australis]
MSNHQRFRLSHLMPNSWFYRLRDMKRPRTPSQRNTGTTRAAKRPSSHYYNGTTTPKPLPLSPRRFYPNLNTKQMSLEKKLRSSHLQLNTKASDIQFPRDHHRHHHHHMPTSRASTIIIEADHEFQDLQLRPIRTRPAPTGSTSAHSAITSGTCPSSPRLRSRSLHVPSGDRFSTTSSSRRRSVARRSFAVVKASTDPPKDFRDSMVEMIVENDVHAPEDLQELMECYLSLNSREYHGVIMEVFRGIWLEMSGNIVED